MLHKGARASRRQGGPGYRAGRDESIEVLIRSSRNGRGVGCRPNCRREESIRAGANSRRCGIVLWGRAKRLRWRRWQGSDKNGGRREVCVNA
jgi:hypothetical protein